MKQWIIFLIITAISIGMLYGCGPSEEEQRRAEQARQDSLEQVRQQQLEQQRRDSIAKARADSLAAQKEEESEDQIDVTFDPDGAYAVQVEAWRSERKAESQVDKWVNRGFENAFVVKHGREETGDVWFRVRLGRLSSRQAAQELRQQLREQYDAPSWISTTSGG
ncbi:Sporulation related domain-containing protein [Fodinibius roseus]|uniref:Sporulation related domain-containing protein n=1 Tax=Fodinibius roseus TaxID=1194090 RepID=A0A1M5GIY0_9BACT|nr:SPOR domain-containing protein [Fodinibius roseus]SHG03669.1 Sporulation related domain-containing protein [Fodinibius roseus]